MPRSIHLILFSVVAASALLAATPALGDAPAKETSVVTFGPFVDDETCSFPISVTGERTRTTTTFANGDVKRHVELVVTSSANGKTLIEREAYNVFVAADAPDAWVITGSFGHVRLEGGGTVVLQSGRILYDVVADQVIDVHQGPHLTRVEDVACDALAP